MCCVHTIAQEFLPHKRTRKNAKRKYCVRILAKHVSQWQIKKPPLCCKSAFASVAVLQHRRTKPQKNHGLRPGQTDHRGRRERREVMAVSPVLIAPISLRAVWTYWLSPGGIESRVALPCAAQQPETLSQCTEGGREGQKGEWRSLRLIATIR